MGSVRLAIHFPILHFTGILRMFSQNTPWNMKHSPYTFCISCEFHVLLMPLKNKPRNPLGFCMDADPGTKGCEMWKVKKRCKMGKKWREISCYTLFIFTRLCSRRVVMRLVVVYVRSFVPSLIQPQVFNIFWPNLKYRKKKVPRRFYAILYWVMVPHKFVINYYFKLGQLDIAGRLWLKYYIYNTAENTYRSQKTFKLKVVRHWILSKKIHEGICLSSPWMGLVGSKVLYGWNIIFTEKVKNTFHLELNTAENTHHSQKTFK